MHLLKDKKIEPYHITLAIFITLIVILLVTPIITGNVIFSNYQYNTSPLSPQQTNTQQTSTGTQTQTNTNTQTNTQQTSTQTQTNTGSQIAQTSLGGFSPNVLQVNCIDRDRDGYGVSGLSKCRVPNVVD